MKPESNSVELRAVPCFRVRNSCFRGTSFYYIHWRISFYTYHKTYACSKHYIYFLFESQLGTAMFCVSEQ